jgi:hypothetical protein
VSIAAGGFTAVQLVECAVHADEEHVRVGQQHGQVATPGGEFDDASTIRSSPAAASAGRHRWKPAKNRGVRGR